MKKRINAGVAKGQAEAPPSKSNCHRLLIAAALAKGTSIIRGVVLSEDILATIDALTALGAKITAENGTVTVLGCAGRPIPMSPLFCRESGSTLRFLIPLALLSGKDARLCGTPRLIERGIEVYRSVFAHQSISFDVKEESISAKGQLTPSDFYVKGEISSQFVSGLLFALPLLPEDSTVTVLPPVESRSYIDMTIDTLSRFGIRISEAAPNTFLIKGNQAYRPFTAHTEADWSNSAFLYALNEVGGQVEVNGVDQGSLQGDKICLDYFKQLRAPHGELDLSNCPDLAPILFALAAYSGNECKFYGTKRLKIKESDRAAAMAQELSKMGGRLIIEENCVTVRSGTLQAPRVALWGHNDHRIVMALSVLLTRFGGEIEGTEAVSKSYPHFFDTIKMLGIEVQDVT